MTLRTLPLFLFLFLGISRLSASSDSSRVAELFKIINENRSDSTLAFSSLAKAIDIASSSSNEKLVADVHVAKGVLFYLRAEYDSSSYYWESANEIYRDLNDTLLWAKTERFVGVSFDLRGMVDSSLKHLIIARDLYKAINNRKGIGEVYLSLGIIQQKLKRFKAAVETNRSALEIAFEEGNNGVIGPIYNNLGSLFTTMQENDSGFKYLNLALEFQEKVIDEFGKSKILHNIGTIEIERKNYESAKNYYLIAMELLGGTNSVESLQGIVSVGRCYMLLNQFDSARIYLKEGIEIASIHGNPTSFQSIYKFLAYMAEQDGNYKDALKYNKLYAAYSDSIFQESLKVSIHELEAGMELEFEKNRNEDLKKSGAEIERLLEKNRKGVMILVALSVVLVLLIAILIRNMGRLRSGREELALVNEDLVKKTQELEANNRRLEIIMTNKNDLVSVMAHDLRSPFGKIQSIVELFNLSEDPEEQQSYLQMLDNITKDGMGLIQDLIDLSRIEGNEVVDEHMKRLSTFELDQIFNNLKSSFTSQLNAKKLNLVLDLSKEPLLNREDYCERICDNILSNAIKYSLPGGNIHVRSEVEVDFIKIYIRDNGPGFKDEDMNRLFQRFSRLSARPTGIENSTGLGLYIAKKLAESIHGDIRLVSQPNEPAEFCIQFALNLKRQIETKSST